MRATELRSPPPPPIDCQLSTLNYFPGRWQCNILTSFQYVLALARTHGSRLWRRVCVSYLGAELARITTEEERTRYFALLKVSFVLGLALGPALNIFLKEFDFYIGNWHIDFRTSPGFFMSLMWILVTGIMYVFVYDLSDEMRKEKGTSFRRSK